MALYRVAVVRTVVQLEVYDVESDTHNVGYEELAGGRFVATVPISVQQSIPWPGVQTARRASLLWHLGIARSQGWHGTQGMLAKLLGLK